MCAFEAGRRRRRSWRGAGVAIALAAALVACRGGGEEPGALSSPPPTVPAESRLAARFPGRDPSLRWDLRRANLHVVYVEEGASGPRIAYRRLGEAPAGPVFVSPDGARVSSHAEVPPVLEALPDGTLVVAYTVSLPGKWKGEIHLQRSTDGGLGWSPPAALHDDGGRGGSHSFLDSVLGPRGEVVFAWLDDRAGQQGVVVASTTDGRTVGENRLTDSRACECCRTALLAGSDDRLWLAYRDLDESSVRDVALIASADRGESFGPRALVSADAWKLEGCPHSGPRLAWRPPDELWVSWFTGAEPGIYAAVSRDGGRSFSAREIVAAPGGDVAAVAHPEIAVLPDGTLAVLYESARENGHAIELRRKAAAPGGGWEPPVRVVANGVYPRLARRGELAAIAWTRLAGDRATEVEVVDWHSALDGQ